MGKGPGSRGGDSGVREGATRVRMRRSPRQGPAASSHKHTPNFYSDDSNSSMSVTSGESGGLRSTGPSPAESAGRKARGSSCGEPPLNSGALGGTTWAGSSRPKQAPRSHTGTAGGAATVRGGASGAGGVEPGCTAGGGA